MKRLKSILKEQENIRIELTIPQTKMRNLAIQIASLVDTIPDKNERIQKSMILKEQHEIYKNICIPLYRKHKDLDLERENIENKLRL